MSQHSQAHRDLSRTHSTPIDTNIRSETARPLGERSRRFAGALLACLLAAALAGATWLHAHLGAAETAHAAGVNVVATTGMIADTARNIAGPHAEVIGLMGPGVDPHLYRASQGDMRKLVTADLILYNGLALEGRMADIFEQMARLKPTVAVTEYIPADRLMAPPDYAGHYDPHVWFDVTLWQLVAERIRDALIAVDPAHKADYERNAREYLDALEQLDAYVRSRIEEVPADKRVLVTAHDAFGYFGRAYGIEVVGLQGISTETEAGLRDVQNLVAFLIQKDIHAVFVESSVPRRSIEAVVEGAAARGHRVVIGGELYSDALGSAGTPEGTYIGMVRHNVDRIVEALKQGASR